MGRVLCRAQPWGRWGQCLGKKKKRRKSCSSSRAPSAAARGASPAGAGDSWGCCVTLGSLSSQTVPSAGDAGANPSVRGFFPSFSHCRSALCWFGALGVCPAGSSVSLLPWLSPASSKALSPVLPSVCDQPSDSLSPPSSSGQAGCNFHEILLGRAVPGLSLGSMCQEMFCGCCSGY